MNIVEQSVGEWFPKRVVTEDQLIEICKQHKRDLIQQSMIDAIENIDYWRNKITVDFV